MHGTLSKTTPSTCRKKTSRTSILTRRGHVLSKARSEPARQLSNTRTCNPLCRVGAIGYPATARRGAADSGSAVLASTASHATEARKLRAQLVGSLCFTLPVLYLSMAVLMFPAASPGAAGAWLESELL